MSDSDSWKRRHALLIASQLPDDPADALQVLEHVRHLIADFIAGGVAPQRPVLAFSSEWFADNANSFCHKSTDRD